MIANSLTTNEIKNAAGTEKEFQRLQTDGRSTEFGLITETPSTPHRLTVSHNETGTGVNRRRRSLIRFDKTFQSAVDTTVFPKTSAYVVLDRPLGHETTDDNEKEVLANLMSFVASLGASTTILYDCTGTGASNLLSGGI
jgi:hypothetical protein